MRFAKFISIFFISVTISYNADATGQKFTISAGIIIGEEPAKSNLKNLSYTCGAAKNKIRLAGFNQLQILNCTGNIYSFSSYSNGKNRTVKINSQTGDISVSSIRK